MTRFLLATDSVHTTAALCDYLEPRLGPDDEITVLAVTGDDLDERDAGDAVNVAGVRLAAAGSVDTHIQKGDPVTAILEYAETIDADEILIGGPGGGSGESSGETTIACLRAGDRPTVVVPVPAIV